MEIKPIHLDSIPSTVKENAPSFEKKKPTTPWEKSSLSSAQDDYDLDIRAILNTVNPHQLTGSVSCPPCNETNNTCHGTQCCSANCSGNANCS